MLDNNKYILLIIIIHFIPFKVKQNIWDIDLNGLYAW